jgi:mycothiol synthase
MTAAGWTIRDGVSSDRAAVQELCRISLLPEDTVDEAGLCRAIWSPAHLQGVQLVAEQDDKLIGFIAGATSCGDDTAGYITAVAVRPDLRRRGVGRDLLDRIEQRLASAGATEVWTAGSQPSYWWPGVDRRYPLARQLFAGAGYSVGDDAMNMVVDLSDEFVAELGVPGVAMRRLTAQEFPRFQSWMGASWQDRWEQEIELTLLREPISCFVAEEGGEYIGFAAYDTNRLGYFGPMGSALPARGRGVGNALLRRCLRDLYLRGDRDCHISWVGPEKFYQDAVSARPGQRFDRLRKDFTA